MLAMQLWSVTPAREIDVWICLWHEMIDFVLYYQNPERLLYWFLESWYMTFIFVMDFLQKHHVTIGFGTN